MTAPVLLVTRPVREADRWVTQLRERGVHAQALPLIDIVPEPMTGPLAAARAQMGSYQVVMFVSGNAVEAFLAPRPADSPLARLVVPGPLRAWSPGPGTTEALRKAGWPPAQIDEPGPDAPQFDSESLWARVHTQVRPGLRVLLVRGGDAEGRPVGRDWLSTRLREAGAVVDEVAAYRRVPPLPDAAWCQRVADFVRDGAAWLFSSSEAIANLRGALPGQCWSGCAAVVTHPRIAQAARGAGFGRVLESRPTLDAVAASIESLA